MYVCACAFERREKKQNDRNVFFLSNLKHRKCKRRFFFSLCFLACRDVCSVAICLPKATYFSLNFWTTFFFLLSVVISVFLCFTAKERDRLSMHIECVDCQACLPKKIIMWSGNILVAYFASVEKTMLVKNWQAIHLKAYINWFLRIGTKNGQRPTHIQNKNVALPESFYSLFLFSERK